MMFKLAAFTLGRRSHCLHYSRVLTPFLANSTRSASITSWQSAWKATLLTGTRKNSLKISSAANSSRNADPITLSQEQKESIPEQLKKFDESLSPKSMLYLLSWVGGTMHRNEIDVKELEKKLSNQEASTFTRLLDCIANNLTQFQNHELAVVVWSLGRIKVFDHRLVKACENEIIARGVGMFDYKSVSQMAWGFSKLNMEKSNVFEEMEKAILRRELNLANFDPRGLAQTIVAFAVTDNGSSELLQVFLESIMARDFSCYGNSDLAQIAWSFAKRDAEADQLFEKIETELFRRGVLNTTRAVDIKMLLWSFSSAKKGSEALFRAFEKVILNLRSFKYFTNSDLSEIIWALGKVGGTSKRVFERLELEIKSREIKAFTTRNRELLTEGYKLAGMEYPFKEVH